ncbi:hypothetical protein C9994_00555 [Marivirga lumbricoides]|uniref:Uncharacterized protein n=1 Tax=Marivirga lumbricoides TaxID=1046115 RepID=A0A2T4DW64_9BACT|nr:hypothetical protein C9994_00555 [Marivirga lumbricoides]
MHLSFVAILIVLNACNLPRILAENAIENPDSLKNLLELQLDSVSFTTEEEVLAYLELTSKLNLSSPADALIFAKALENQLLFEQKKVGEAHIHSYKGNYYWSQGIYGAALKDYFEALKLFEERKDEFEAIKQLNNIGETYKKQKDYQKASRFLNEALIRMSHLRSEEQNTQLIMVNLGQLYMLEDQFDSALYFLDKVLSRTTRNNRTAQGFANLYKGMIKRDRGQFDSASHYFHKSLDIWEAEKFKRSIVETKAELAQLAIMQQNYQLATTTLQETQLDAKQINALDILMRIYQYQIALFKLKGSKDSLISYYEKFISIKDSIFNEETRSEINKLSIQYELSQRENKYYKLALEQNILTNDIKTQSRFLIFLILISLIGFIFIIVLWGQRSNLLKVHQQLKTQKEEIERKQNEIARKSLELANLNKELYALNENLEEKIVQRSEQLTRKNKQIAKYTYFNSHKLRAPVASVLGLINVLELSKNGILDPTILNHLKSCAIELDQIIHNLKNILEAEIDELD